MSVSQVMMKLCRAAHRRRRVLDVQLFQKVTGSAEFVRDEEHVTNVYRNRTTPRVVVEEIVTEPFIVAIEDDTNLFAATIQNWRTRISADDVSRRKKIYRHVLAVRRRVRSKVVCPIKLLQLLRRVEWFAASVFLDNAGE